MNMFRTSFLVVTDLLVVAMLVSLLTGCVATQQRNRNGDFVSHMAATGTQATTPASAHAGAPAAMLSAERA